MATFAFICGILMALMYPSISANLHAQCDVLATVMDIALAVAVVAFVLVFGHAFVSLMLEDYAKSKKRQRA